MAQQSAFPRPQRAGGIVCALTAGLLAGGCAQQSEFPGPGLLSSSEISAPAVLSGAGQPDQAGEPVSEQQLAEATAFWGKRYAETPSDLTAAISYAKNLKAMGQKEQALSVLQQASVFHSDSRELAGEYGRLALELDQIAAAEKLLAFADDPGKPDWRVISARGTVLAKQGKYAESVPFFERALTLAHNHPSLLNNLAMSHAMMGDASKAEILLRQAASSETDRVKVRQNLALVLGLQGKYQESTEVASRDMPPEAAAEEAAYLRKLTKTNPAKPVPASTVQVPTGQLRGSTNPDRTSTVHDSRLVASETGSNTLLP